MTGLISQGVVDRGIIETVIPYSFQKTYTMARILRFGSNITLLKWQSGHLSTREE